MTRGRCEIPHFPRPFPTEKRLWSRTLCFPIATTGFPQAFSPLVHWLAFLTPAKPLSHSILLPVCYNLVAPTALSCKTGGDKLELLLLTILISNKSAFLVFLQMEAVTSSQYQTILVHFSTLKALSWQHTEVARTPHTLQYSQLGMLPL